MHRIRLENEEFEGQNNAYLLVGEEEIGLIDTGIATPGTRDDLAAGLAEAGIKFDDIDTILITHWHADHAGLAGEIQQQNGATIYTHEADAPLVTQDSASLEDYEERQLDRFEYWGMPTEKRDELLAFFEAAETARGDPPTVTPLSDGDRLTIAGTDLLVCHAPGHTLGSCRFEIDGGETAFVGDTILPVYTPNIGGADIRVEDPLATYIETLAAIVSTDYELVWPGHRDPIEDPSTRANTIINHHRERTERVVSVLQEHGPADAWTVSAHLFGELHGIHIMHGPGEADAHLAHLGELGLIECDNGIYQPPVAAIDVDEFFTEGYPSVGGQ